MYHDSNALRLSGCAPYGDDSTLDPNNGVGIEDAHLTLAQKKRRTPLGVSEAAND